MYLAATAGILVAMFLALIRAALGPRAVDRILAVNVFGTKTMLLIAIAGFYAGRPEYWVDLALVYALVNFVGTVAVFKCARFGGLAARDQEVEP
ncbi:MAG: pH regulation protein F [Acidobacteria bacterium]|nr:MAG: pH regulation protein F [Acidobacteriota bacterium]